MKEKPKIEIDVIVNQKQIDDAICKIKTLKEEMQKLHQLIAQQDSASAPAQKEADILQKSAVILFEQLELLAEKSNEIGYEPELAETSEAMVQIYKALLATAITGK